VCPSAAGGLLAFIAGMLPVRLLVLRGDKGLLINQFDQRQFQITHEITHENA